MMARAIIHLSTKTSVGAKNISLVLRALRKKRSSTLAYLIAVIGIAVIGASFLPAFAGAQSLCLRLVNQSGAVHSLPARIGDRLSVRFHHSIYRSQVEERFALRSEGFALAELRYSEARLVDFYGHESATEQDGAWVVTPSPRSIAELNLNLSADAAMTLQLDRQSGTNSLAIQPTGALRLTVAPCQNPSHVR